MDVISWIAEVTGGTVERVERKTGGSSRSTSLVDVRRPDGVIDELVVRADTGDGPFSGTAFTLEREAAVYRALAGTRVPVPKVVTVADDGMAFLMGRVRGADKFDQIQDGEERRSVSESVLRAVAELHHVDVDALDLPGFERPANPEEHALLDLKQWEWIFAQRVDRPEPIVTYAFQWLKRNTPARVDRTVLCWGDLGPGNFLFDGGEVTALLDWEIAHIGDPLDDAAFLVARAHLLFDGSFGDVDWILGRYSELSGVEIDRQRYDYYLVQVLVRWMVAALAALDGRKGADMAGSTYLFLTTTVRKWLALALANASGVSLDDVDIPEGGAGRLGETLDMLAADLNQVLVPALSGDNAVQRAMGMNLLISHAAGVDRMGQAVEDAELADIARVLGEEPATLADGLRALDGAICSSEPERDAELIRFFHRSAERGVALIPLVAPYAARPLPTPSTWPGATTD